MKIKCLSNNSEIVFPKDCTYFYTNYYRIVQKDKNQLKLFLKIAWESLSILKE